MLSTNATNAQVYHIVTVNYVSNPVYLSDSFLPPPISTNSLSLPVLLSIIPIIPIHSSECGCDRMRPPWAPKTTLFASAIDKCFLPTDPRIPILFAVYCCLRASHPMRTNSRQKPLVDAHSGGLSGRHYSELVPLIPTNIHL